MHQRSAGMTCVVIADMTNAGRLEHPCPPGCQRVRTQCRTPLIDDDEPARFVLLAKQELVGRLDGTRGAKTRRQVIRNWKRSAPRTRLRCVLKKMLSETQPSGRYLQCSRL